jgi:hypothetical protein
MIMAASRIREMAVRIVAAKLRTVNEDRQAVRLQADPYNRKFRWWQAELFSKSFSTPQGSLEILAIRIRPQH